MISPQRLSPALTLLLVTCLVTGCVKVERTTGIAAIKTRFLVAEGTVTVEHGGTIEATARTNPHRGVKLVVPPVAVAEDTKISIFARYGDPRFPSVVQTFEIEPADIQFVRPAELTIQYSELYAYALEPLLFEDQIEVFSTSPNQPESGFQYKSVHARDTDLNLLSFDIQEAGQFACMHGTLYAMIYQTPKIIDPNEAIQVADVRGQVLEVTESSQTTQVGQGSLKDFWSTDSSQNLLVIHGLMSTPFHMQSFASFVPPEPNTGFKGDFRNTLVFQYPSGHSIAANANRLYDIIDENRTPGFGFNIVAHSAGGLVARYLIEKSHLDPSRPGYSEGDPKIDDLVDNLVFVGTPNKGATVAGQQFGELISTFIKQDAPFVQGLLDLIPGPSGFTNQLNNNWEAPATKYFAIAGDTGLSRGDGVVEVASALGLPVEWSRNNSHYQVFNGPIYEHASLSAFADRTGVIAQGRAWFNKNLSNTPPVVGSIITPVGTTQGEADIEFRLTDQDLDPCALKVEFSLDGGQWNPATTAFRGTRITNVASQQAPGKSLLLVWNARLDTGSITNRFLARIRITPFDRFGPGTTGISGLFLVDD